MSRRDPPSLLDLAVQSLLSDDSCSTHALGELPGPLFPTVLTAALTGGHTKTVKAMVRFWPSPCLRLGSLRELSESMLEAVLDGLKLVSADTTCPRRSKLKMLDLICDNESSHREKRSETLPIPFLITNTREDSQVDIILKNPLESLIICNCTLTEDDVADLSKSINAHCLKKLVFSNISLPQMILGPLEFLLGKVSGTLQHLNLRNCWLVESQLRSLLPALLRCSHLWSLVLGGSVISTSGFMCMLQQLAGLKALKYVQYPVPAEYVKYSSNSRSGNLKREELAQVHATLQAMLQALQRADM